MPADTPSAPGGDGESKTPMSRLAEVFATTQRWVLLLTTAFLPVAYGRGAFNDVFNLPKLTLLMVAVAVAGTLRMATFVLGVRRTAASGLAIPAGVTILALTLSWVLSQYLWWGLLGSYTRYGGWLPYVVTIVFGLLLADAFAGSPRTIVVALVVGGSIVGAVALQQMLFEGFEIGSFSPGAFVTSTVGNSNFAGGYLAIMLALSLGLWMEPGRISKLGMAATVPTGSGLIFTMSEGAWFAAAAGAIGVMAVLSSTERPAFKKALMWAAGIIAVLPALVVLVTVLLPDASGRLPGFLESAVSRGLHWRQAFELALDRPLFGWGPNAFYIEGPLHRGVQDALLLGEVKADDPHSVPLAMLVNLGILGLASFLFAIAWAFRKMSTNAPSSPVAAGLTGALIAYVAQALVSVDEMTLRFAFWALLAAVGACVAPRVSIPLVASSSAPRTALSLSLVATGLLAAAITVQTLVVPDLDIAQGLKAYYRGQPALARARLADGVAGRGDPEYKRLYAAILGNTAFNQGESGARLIEEMNEVFDYLHEFPDPQALLLQGDLLNQWSLYEPSANQDALEVFRRVQRMDPYNPLVGIRVADVLVQQGWPGRAEDVLLPYVRLVGRHPKHAHRFGELWSALSIAQIKQDRISEAASTLSQAAEPHACRYHVASELLRAKQGRPSSGVNLGFICPNAMRTLFGRDNSTSST